MFEQSSRAPIGARMSGFFYYMNLRFSYTKIAGKVRASAAALARFRPISASLSHLPLFLWRHRVLAALLLVVCVFGAEFGLLKLPKANAAYTIANSARFISGNSDELTKIFGGSPTSQQKGTISVWVRRAVLGSRQTIAAEYDGTSANSSWLEFNSSDQLNFSYGGTATFLVTSNALYRDPAAWLHIVAAWDSTQATASNRVRLYVNGQEVTSLSSAAYPTQNANFQWAQASLTSAIGAEYNSTVFLDGYLADFYYIDGTQLAPTCFGTTDANGYWRPITYSTASPCAAYGTNGFHLAFGNGAALGTDTSGNSNTFTASGLAATDQVIDTPTNSFATTNPLKAQLTPTNGNLAFNGLGGNYNLGSTFAMSSGKWYWEFLGPGSLIGIAPETELITSLTNSRGYFSDGQKYLSGTGSAYGATWTSTDVIGIAYDADVGTLTFYKNGVSQGSAYTGVTGVQVPWFRTSATGVATVNFGQGGQSGLTYDSASGGYFKYTPPSGFKALSTANLPTPTITKPNNYFDVALYAGTGATQTITGTSTNFTPDIVWIKDRTTTNAHGIFDSARTATKYWSSNANTAETTDAQSLTAFATNGFSLGTTALFNTSGNNYISWMWKKCPAISGSCLAADGVDIVTYTGTGAAHTVAHNLGAVPDMIIVKRRDTTGDAAVYHTSQAASPQNNYMLLDSTAATAADSTYWNNTAPTSAVFTVGTNANVDANTGTYVAYLFKGIDGFSKFGSYTGNGSADGPFIYTGFKPRYIMFKRTDSTGSWHVADTARSTYNPNNLALYPDSTSVSESGDTIGDFLSNGFKIRNTQLEENTSGGTYIYAAFADVPFYYSAQPAASAASGFVAAIAFLMGMTF